MSKKLFKEYLLGKQTLKQLSFKYDRSIPWIKKQLDAFEPEARHINPSAITIVADATFYGKKSDRLGTLVFKEILRDKIVACKHIESETANDYKQLADELIEQGFIIQEKKGQATFMGSKKEITYQYFFQHMELVEDQERIKIYEKSSLSPFFLFFQEELCLQSNLSSRVLVYQ